MADVGSPASCLNTPLPTLPQIDKTGLLETIASMTSHPSQSMSSTTITVQAEAALDPYRFNMFMADLLSEHGKQITHMAGTLNVQVTNEVTRHFKIEGAQQTVRFGPCSPSAKSNARTHSSLSFTGLDLLQQELQEALNTCLWQALPTGWTEYFSGQRPFYVHHATAAKQWQRPASSSQSTQSTQVLPPSQVLPSAQLTQTHEASDRLPQASVQGTAPSDNASAQQMPFEGYVSVSELDSKPAAVSVCAVPATETPSRRFSRSMSGTKQLQSHLPADRREFDGQFAQAPSTSLPALQRSALFEAQLSRPYKAKRARSDSTPVVFRQARPSKLSAAAMRSKQDLWQALLRCNGMQWPSASPTALTSPWLTTLSF